MNNRKGGLSIRIWVTILIFMLMGSVAAGVESMFLGLYLNNTVFKHGSMGAPITLTDTINLISSLSAVVLGITTFVVGTISEKMKNRKLFISVGYILWGIVMLIFSFIRGGNIGRYFGLTEMSDIVFTTAIFVIVFSLILTLLRATTNNTSFNVWVTDISTPQTSAIIETCFTVVGFVATGIITYLITKAQSDEGDYSDVFRFLGMVAILVGALGFVLFEKPKQLKNLKKKKEKEEQIGWKDVFYGFRPSVIKKNRNLYLILSSGCLFNCAYQVFYPYLFIYLASVVIPENTDIETHPLKILCLIAVALLIAVATILLLMKIYKKNKAIPFISSVLCFIVGLLILSSTKNIMGIIIGLTPGLIGYAIIMIQFGATVRDNTPKDKIGLFQGIKTIFLFFVPKIIGPTLGNIASTNSSVTYMDNGSEKVLPTEAMFLYAAVVATLIFIPMLAFLKKDKERALKEENK